MAITVNEGGTLYELDEVWSNEGGTLYEQDSVHSNEGGTLFEIHSGTSYPDTLVWDATGKSNFSYSKTQQKHIAAINSASPGDTTVGNATTNFSIKGNVKIQITFSIYLTGTGSGGWNLYKDGIEVAGSAFTESASGQSQTVELTTGDYSLYFGAGGGSSSGSYYGRASITLQFTKP